MQFKHTTKKGLVTIACHRMSDDIARGTVAIDPHYPEALSARAKVYLGLLNIDLAMDYGEKNILERINKYCALGK